VFRRILTIDADNLGAIHALQRTTERAGRFQEVVQALELEADKSRDEEQVVALLHRAGEVLDEQLRDRSGALVRFRRVLEINPRYTPALVSLGRIYYAAGRWEDLLEMYKRELELTPKGPEAVALLHKMGELCEVRIGRDDEAITHYRHAIENDAKHAPSLRALGRKLREREDYPELVKVLELELEGLTDPLARTRTAFRIGEIYEQRLGDTDRALASYGQALEATPAFRPAVAAVSRLRSQRRAWDRLVDDLKREAETTPDPSIAVGAWMRQGEIWADEMDEPRRAIQCFEAVLTHVRGHVGALLSLEQLYRRIGAWSDLGTVYRAQADLFTDGGAQAAALRELARLQEAHAVEGDPLETYRRVLTLTPSDPSTLDALERLALERGDYGTLSVVDQKRSELAPDRMSRAVYLTRLAESYEAAGDLGRALDAFRSALDVDVEALGAAAGLARIAEVTNDPVTIAEAARHAAGVASDGAEAARLLVRSARVRTERLDDRAGARDDLERALELAPDYAEAADRLVPLMIRLGQVSRLADLLSRAAGAARNPERTAALWLTVAELHADHLDNLPGAISSLNRVLKAAPNHIATLRNLASLYGRDNQWSEAVNLLSRVVQLAPDRGALRDAHLELAGIWDERLGETPRALVSLQAVLALDATNAGALARLTDIQTRDGKLEQAADTAARLIQVAETDEARASALIKLAGVEDARGNPRQATEALLQALALEGPGSESGLELKSRLSTPTGWDHYARALTSYLERARARKEDVTAVYRELARVKQDQLGMSQAAIEVLRTGIGERGDPTALRLDLSTRLRTMGDNLGAVKELRTLLRDDVTRADTYREIARSYDAMGRPVETRLAVMPLVVLGAATETETKHIADHPPRPAGAAAGSMDPELLAQLGPKGKAAEAAIALLVTLSEGLPKLTRTDLEAYGLSPRDRITSRQGHPLRAVADRIAAIAGVSEFDLFVHRVRTRGVAVELLSPPALLVPAWLADLTESQQVFLLARPLVAIARQLHAVEKLTPRELEVLLASAARGVVPGYGAGLTSEEDLESQAKRLPKALSRRSRKVAEQLARQYVEAPRLDFASWAADLSTIATRLAALLSDDLPGCVEAMQRNERELSGLTGSALVLRSPDISDLMKFWLSESAMAIRARLGMTPPA
jgi:tetratricopeptide (TPR) repeat protein